MERENSEKAIFIKESSVRRPFNTACVGVIMAVFNEAKTIDEIIRRVLAQPCVCEVVAIDDGSSDGTADLLRSWQRCDSRIRCIGHGFNRGKGAAIRTGWAASTAPIVIIQDADLEYDPSDYPRMLDLIVSGQADVVYGSRFGGKNNLSNPAFHTFGNRCLTLCSNLASGMNLTDEATCYKMFRREILAQIDLEENGFGFCPEVTAKISKLCVRVREVAISYSGRTKAEGKKIRLKDGWNALACIVKYNLPRRLRSKMPLFNSVATTIPSGRV
jgi:glycosyltransferase involved in cell wall biosynthesis